MCIYQEHVYIFAPNMKFLCLTMWLGLYTDNSDTDRDNDGQSMIVLALWLINQMSQKVTGALMKFMPSVNDVDLIQQGGHVRVKIKFPVFTTNFNVFFQYISNKYFFFFFFINDLYYPIQPSILPSLLFNNNIVS